MINADCLAACRHLGSRRVARARIGPGVSEGAGLAAEVCFTSLRPHMAIDAACVCSDREPMPQTGFISAGHPIAVLSSEVAGGGVLVFGFESGFACRNLVFSAPVRS